MSDTLAFSLSGIAGLGLGAMFFGGLWWTVRRGLSSPQPALWFLGSLLLRMSCVLVGFYLVSGGNWQRLVFCLLGFLTARFVVTRLSRPRKEAIHAP